MEKLKMHSPDSTEWNIAKLAELFPNCVTESQSEDGTLQKTLDFDLLRQELSGSIVEGPQERFQINWPGKRASLFAANAQIAKTLRPVNEESVNRESTQNLFIEGDNLDALKLLQETYLGKIKMIYIDPPYNTGNDFVYEDDFAESRSEYLSRSLQTDDATNRLVANPESNGRFHSDWLGMMYSRLKLCRNLLSDDGVIFISIDDREVASLRRLCDEVFGEDQFISEIVIQSNKRGQTYKEISKTHEYLLVYVRDGCTTLNELEKEADSLPYSDSIGGFDLWELRNRNPKFGRFNRPNLFYPIYVSSESIDECGYSRISLERSGDFTIEAFPLNSQGVEGCWRWGKDKVKSVDLTGATPVLVAKQRRDGAWNIYEKSRKSTTKAKSIWGDNEVISEQGTIELGALGLANVFDHPKPKGLVRRCIELATTSGDIVLDFFAGSATTAHAVFEANASDSGNRRFILIQLPEICNDESNAKAEGFATIAEIAKERIRRAGKKVKEDNAITAANLDVGFRVLKIDSSNMKDVFYSPDSVKQGDLLYQIDNIKDDRTAEDLLFQVLLDWGVDLSLSISQESCSGKSVFFVDGNALAACFDTDVSEELVRSVAAKKPLRAVFRDAGFSSDSAKINVEQIFKLLSPSTELRCI